MKKNNKKMKAIVLSLGLGAAMLTAPSVQAQGVFGDMLDNYYEEQDQGSRGALLKGGRSSDYNNDLSLQNFGGGEDGLTLQNFGEAPLGSGWLILMASCAGYAAMKSRKKQNTRKK